MSKRSQRRAVAKAAATNYIGAPSVAAPAVQRVSMATPSTRPIKEDGKRGMMMPGLGFGGGGVSGPQGISAPYEAASMHSSIPYTGNMGPVNLGSYQPLLASLARYYYRNDSWIRRVVNKMGDNVVGTGPIPTSPYDDLNELFMLWWHGVDTRGINHGGNWLRKDVYRPFKIDGEVFLRKRTRSTGCDPMGRPIPAGDLVVPLQFQSLTADYFPIYWNQWMKDSQVVSAIEFDSVNPDQRLAYWGYQQFPGDFPRMPLANLSLQRIPASEVIHYLDAAMPGSPRGEVPLASAIIRAIKLGRLEDSEMTRMEVASRFAGYIKETTQTAGESQLAGVSEDVLDGLTRLISMEAGMIYRLPPGMEMTWNAPPQAQPMAKEVRYAQLSNICAAIGIPLHEITLDFTDVKSDRVIKFASLSYKQVVDTEQSCLEDQVMMPIWCSFVDYAILTGLWTPPSKKDQWRAYQPTWRWPRMITSQITQEIATMITAIEADIIDPDTVSQDYFGVSSKYVLRSKAEWAARRKALGYVGDPIPTVGGGLAPALEGWAPENSPLAAEIFARVSTDEAAVQEVISESSSH